MNEFKNTSEQGQWEVPLLLGQLIKEKPLQQIKDAKWFSILGDEVIDYATVEQLLFYIDCIDEEAKPRFDFLEVKEIPRPSRESSLTS